MEKIKDIYQAAIDQGLNVDHYESTLYLQVNEKSQDLVDRYEFKQNVKTFISCLDQELWFDIPFAYSPFWTKKIVK